MGSMTKRAIIVLTGPKHAGKTSVGKALAALLGGNCTDLDEFIEQREGKSPRTLYKEGPEVFRKAEAEALEALIGDTVFGEAAGGVYEAAEDGVTGGSGEAAVDSTVSGPDEDAADCTASDPGAEGPQVIAAGGGLADNAAALGLLKARRGAVYPVYLEVSADTAWARIERSAAESGELPPFLNTADPRETHRQLHERRGAVYREIACLTVQGEDRTPAELGQEILRAYEAGNASAAQS
jgi:shikimate kinase